MNINTPMLKFFLLKWQRYKVNTNMNLRIISHSKLKEETFSLIKIMTKDTLLEKEDAQKLSEAGLACGLMIISSKKNRLKPKKLP